MGNKKKWVRLKKVLQRLNLIKIQPSRGDGGFISDTTAVIIRNRFQKDTTFIINDSAVVARPMH